MLAMPVTNTSVASVEHYFRGNQSTIFFQNTRYRGLEKITSRVNLMIDLSNLYILRWLLITARRRSASVVSIATDVYGKSGRELVCSTLLKGL